MEAILVIYWPSGLTVWTECSEVYARKTTSQKVFTQYLTNIMDLNPTETLLEILCFIVGKGRGKKGHNDLHQTVTEQCSFYFY